MVGANIDNAVEAIQAGIAQLNTVIESGKTLSDDDVTTLNELSETTRQLRNKAICYYATFFDQKRVAAAFRMSEGRVSQIVNEA